MNRIVIAPNSLAQAVAEELAVNSSKTLSVEQAARLLGVSRGSAYQAVKNGSFPSPVIRLGNRYLIPRAPLERLLDEDRDPEVTG